MVSSSKVKISALVKDPAGCGKMMSSLVVGTQEKNTLEAASATTKNSKTDGN